MAAAMTETDLFVIGAGSAGVRAARVAAGLGARVTVAEERRLGGTCVNVGCIPKKLMVYAAGLGAATEDARAFGWRGAPGDFDWPSFREQKDREIQRLNDVYQKLLEDARVQVLQGHAKLKAPDRVVVGDKQFKCRHILLAMGGEPVLPQIPGAQHALVSDDMFALEALPKRALVLGGGYIATEFAGILKGLGVNTTLAYRGDLFLRGFDLGLREFLRDEMVQAGLELRFGAMPRKIEKTGEGTLRVHFEQGAPGEADLVLSALGRRPRTQGLGLENTAVELDGTGRVQVDSGWQTAEPSIFALGDVIGGPNLTPVAIAEGEALVRRLFDEDSGGVEYTDIPTAVFSQPPLATVGLREDEARALHREVAVYTSVFRPLKNRLSGHPGRSCMKLVALPGAAGRVLGVHMAGEDAPEIVQGFAVAIKAGASVAEFKRTIGIHPTAAEELVTIF